MLFLYCLTTVGIIIRATYNKAQAKHNSIMNQNVYSIFYICISLLCVSCRVRSGVISYVLLLVNKQLLHIMSQVCSLIVKFDVPFNLEGTPMKPMHLVQLLFEAIVQYLTIS
jgi:hypothetical protein